MEIDVHHPLQLFHNLEILKMCIFRSQFGDDGEQIDVEWNSKINI